PTVTPPPAPAGDPQAGAPDPTRPGWVFGGADLRGCETAVVIPLSPEAHGKLCGILMPERYGTPSPPGRPRRRASARAASWCAWRSGPPRGNTCTTPRTTGTAARRGRTRPRTAAPTAHGTPAAGCGGAGSGAIRATCSETKTPRPRPCGRGQGSSRLS